MKDKIVKVPGVVGWGTLTADERKKQASRMGKVGGKISNMLTNVSNATI